MLGLLDQTLTKRISNAVAAGTTDSTSSAVDAAGFNSALFQVHLGAIVAGAVTSVKVRGSDDDSTYVDLEGTSVTVADTDDNNIVQIEVIKPKYRYMKTVTSRATQNSTIDSIVCILSNAGALKPTQTTVGNEQHVTPGSGTA